MLNTHDRTTLRRNHRIFHHDFETALDHDDDDDDDNDDDEGQPILKLFVRTHRFLTFLPVP